MPARAKTIMVLALAALAAGGLPATATPPPPDDTVTLLTGDRVSLRPDGTVARVDPAPGRADVRFHTLRDGTRTHVVPADATRLLAADRLDPRLFDVTLLRELGGDTLPLIVDGPVSGVAVTRRLPGLTAVRADLDGRDWQALTRTRKVWLDGRRRVSLDESVPRTGAPAAWAAGVTGEGVTVAVLDTGIDQTHPDLAGQETAERNFSDSPDNADRVGHGTHVAATVAGRGDPYRGVAPGAKVLDGKVIDDDGWATDSAIIAGMHWAVEQGARVVNLSLGAADTRGVDPVEETVNTLSAEHGTLFVVAAGNEYRPGTIGSPASAAAALAVSAVDRDGAVALFASRGPGLDNVAKPEITAPGVDITAAVPGGAHDSLSGTSMATPHVSGAAALLAQRHRDWSGQRIRAALTGSAASSTEASVFEQGAGMVDVARALDASVYAVPAALDLGVERYPHEEPVTKALTYRNDGPTDVTLDLAVDATGFDLGAARVTVPAGGEAAVDVTSAPSAGAPGAASATVTASAGGLSVRTPVAVVWEPESYDLTIDVIGLDGRPATGYDVLRMGFGEDGWEFLYDPDGSITARVPAGPNPLKATVYGSAHQYVVTAPGLTVTKDTRITLDARTARPIEITLPADVSPDGFDVGFAAHRPDGLWNSHSVMYASPAGVSVAHAGPVLPRVPGPRFGATTWLSGQWGGNRYNLAWFEQGRAHTGLTATVRPRDLAKVTTGLAARLPGTAGRLLLWPSPLGGFDPVYPGPLGQAAAVDGLELPTERVTYVSADVEWTTRLDQFTEDGAGTSVGTPERRFLAGREFRQELGRPVTGPALPPTRYATPGASRTGDELTVEVPLFGDAAGNSGSSSYDTGHSALYRDGSLIGETPAAGGGWFELPPSPGTYRLTTSATRSGFDLSTRVEAAWTFRSAHVPGDQWARVPLSVVGFRPDLDGSGPAPDGPFAVPVVVSGPSGEPVRPRRLTVEVSYDEGASWRPVPVTGDHVARLDHPAGADSVSLRAKAVNRDGTTAEVTIVRAYPLDH